METDKAKHGYAGPWHAAVLLSALLMLVIPGTLTAKSLYVVANHHTGQFDAYGIEPLGTDPPVTYQARYNLSHAGDPADVAVWIEPGTNPPEGALFITSEFDAGFEVVDAKTMTSLGSVSGPSNLGGIDVDDARNIIYTVRRSSDDLYVYDWDPVARNVTLQAGYPIDLPNCVGAIDIALDETAGLLYVADTRSELVRIYDVTTWAEVGTIVPSIPPVGMALDRQRGFLYTTHPDSTCASLPQYSNYTLLSKYDLTTGTETTVDMGYGGMGIAVEELTGRVYVTCGCSGDDMQVYDSSLNLVYSTGPIGNPAGIAIGNIGYNPLNLAKNDRVVGHGVYIGQTFTYEITYDNEGNQYDVTGVTITDNLPPELDFVSETKDGVAGTGTYDSGTHTVIWNVGTIPAGATGPRIDLVVKINNKAVPGTTICNYCRIDSDQTGPTLVEGTDPDDPSGEPGTYIKPTRPLQSFLITKAEIGWTARTFSVCGNFQLPAGYHTSDLTRSATLYIQVDDEQSKDTVSFQDFGQTWAYTESMLFGNGSGEGMNVTKFDITWSPMTHSFHIQGQLSFPTVGCDTLPPQATVMLEIPVASNKAAGCVIGECTCEFNVEGDIWYCGLRPESLSETATIPSDAFFNDLFQPTASSQVVDSATDGMDRPGDRLYGRLDPRGSVGPGNAPPAQPAPFGHDDGVGVPWFDVLFSFGTPAQPQDPWTGGLSQNQGDAGSEPSWFEQILNAEDPRAPEYPPPRRLPLFDGAGADDPWLEQLRSLQP